MYAVIEDSGSQIKVSEGDVIRVAKRDMPEDQATLVFDRVMLIGPSDGEAEGDAQIGQPFVDGAKVTADVLAAERTKRVPVVKFKRRKGYTRRRSHRQDYLKVKITAIKG